MTLCRQQRKSFFTQDSSDVVVDERVNDKRQITMQWHLLKKKTLNHGQKKNSSGKLIRLLSKNTVMNVGSAQKNLFDINFPTPQILHDNFWSG